MGCCALSDDYSDKKRRLKAFIYSLAPRLISKEHLLVGEDLNLSPKILFCPVQFAQNTAMEFTKRISLQPQNISFVMIKNMREWPSIAS